MILINKYYIYLKSVTILYIKLSFSNLFFFQFPESVTGNYFTHPVENISLILKPGFIKEPRVNNVLGIVSNIVTSYLTRAFLILGYRAKKGVSAI